MWPDDYDDNDDDDNDDKDDDVGKTDWGVTHYRDTALVRSPVIIAIYI